MKAKKNRTRRKTYFNPPFSKNLRTNVGQQFLKIIDRCFLPENKLHKIFNRSKVKLSYRTMNILGSIIPKYNKQILNQDKVEIIIIIMVYYRTHKNGTALNENKNGGGKYLVPWRKVLVIFSNCCLPCL